MTRSSILFSWTLIYFMILDISWKPADAQTYDNMTTLKKELLLGYDKDVIPLFNQSHELNISVTFSLIAIPEVDTVNSFMKLRAFLYLSWLDEKLTWVPAHYGNIQETSLPAGTVWTPPVFLGSGVTLESLVSSWRKVSIEHNGYSTVALGGTLTNTCEFTMAFWPFDKQACTLYFIPFNSGMEKMNFIFPSNPIHEQDFIQMGEWTYDQIAASYQDRFDGSGNDIIYTVKIRRQSAFYILTLILPMYCVSFLGQLVFLIPCDSGERVGFAVTIMLSMVVFMMVIKDEVPKSSEPLPYICIYINASMVVAFICNIINIFSLSLYYRNEAQPVGRKYKYLVHLFMWLRCNGRRIVQPENMENNNKDGNAIGLSPEKRRDDRLRSIRKDHFGPVEQDFTSEQNVNQEIIVAWTDVSRAIDKITFIIVAPISTLTTIVGGIYLQAASEYPDWSN